MIFVFYCWFFVFLKKLFVLPWLSCVEAGLLAVQISILKVYKLSDSSLFEDPLCMMLRQ